MKKVIYSLILLSAIFFIACNDDLNDGVDYISPKAVLDVDSLEVSRGETVTLKATVKDPSGISYVSLTYAGWNVSEEIKFEEDEYQKEYSFEYSLKVPENAELEWTEDYVKNDGTRFKIKQQYHKLSLTCYDGVNNKNIYYFYIKAK